MIKVGTIGTGFITNWLIEAINANEGCRVEAVYSRNFDSGKKLADTYGIKKVYTDLDVMINDADINFIYVASPNSMHYEHCKKILLSGKNVICEKPFSSNSKELKELKKIAEEKRLFLFEAITTIHNPNYKVIKDYLNSIKPIKVVQANMSQYSRKYDQFKNGENPNVFTLKFSGGALMDINIYNLHFIMGLFGKPNKTIYTANIKDGIDTSGNLTMMYDGFIASAVGSKDNIGRNFVQIQGENGYIYIDSSASTITNVHVYIRNGKDIEVSNALNYQAHYYEINDIYKMYKSSDFEECYNLLDYSIQVMEVVDEAKASAGIKFLND